MAGPEVVEIGEICDSVSLNSFNQLQVHGRSLEPLTSIGLRVNTRISSIRDNRYDPCREASKLGIPIENLRDAFSAHGAPAARGVHIHTNADSVRLEELEDNLEALVSFTPKSQRFEWVNLGGGYLFEELDSFEFLAKLADRARSELGDEVYLEPGAALVRSAIRLVSEVQETFAVDGQHVAVLDTSVNHLPEVLEFDDRPAVRGTAKDGPFRFILVGKTCLAGDVFGEYEFEEPLHVGSRVVFEDVGAYSLTKANRFNGVNLPSICSVSESGSLAVLRTFSYDEYASQWTQNV